MSDVRGAPRRFVDAGGPTGELLRRALENQEPGGTLPRFVDLRERRARRVRFYRVGGALAAASLSLLALVAVRSATVSDQTPAIGAERFTAQAGSERPNAAAPVAEHGVASPRLSPVAVAPGVLTPDRPKQRPVNALPLPRSRPSANASEAPPAVADTTALATAKSCAQIARGGAAEEAIACYEQLASGSGVSAELALFEQARLAGKVLHQPERALLTLANYRKRFPRGSLRAEVMLAQIDWLVSSGQSARALPLVEEALGSGLLQERARELEQVRDRLRSEAAVLEQR